MGRPPAVGLPSFALSSLGALILLVHSDDHARWELIPCLILSHFSSTVCPVEPISSACAGFRGIAWVEAVLTADVTNQILAAASTSVAGRTSHGRWVPRRFERLPVKPELSRCNGSIAVRLQFFHCSLIASRPSASISFRRHRSAWTSQDVCGLHSSD